MINSGIFDDNPSALNAWLKFIEDGKYRAANGEDFKFSEAAKSELRSMFEDEWYSRVKHPAITGNISRRNVKADTVLQMTVHPKTKPHFSELGLEERKYIKTRDDDDAVTVYYTSVDDGIRYAVQSGEVVSVEYRPSSRDKEFRCEGFPDYDGGIREYRPYATFSTKAQMIDERLDDFAIQLINRTNMKGYIVTYAGKTARKNEATAMAIKAKEYLTAKRKISPDRVVAIDGGFRETAEYDLFLIPSTSHPPTPTPTLPSNEVKIVRIHKTSKNHHLSLRGYN